MCTKIQKTVKTEKHDLELRSDFHSFFPQNTNLHLLNTKYKPKLTDF